MTYCSSCVSWNYCTSCISPMFLDSMNTKNCITSCNYDSNGLKFFQLIDILIKNIVFKLSSNKI